MTYSLAEVTFSTTQALLLIAACSGSLILSLYCALFMVPVKRFLARIQSLGGGMNGLENHINGLKNETDRRVASVENSICTVTEDLNILQDEIRRLMTSVANEATEADELHGRIDAVTRGLEEFQTELRALRTEMRQSVSHQVSDSYHCMEGRMLSALEALRDEMLRQVRRPHLSVTPAAPARGAITGRSDQEGHSRRRAPASKIIPALSLFNEMGRAEQNAQDKAQDEAPAPKEAAPAS